MLYARSLLVRQGCHRALPAAKAAAETRKFRHVKSHLFAASSRDPKS